MKKITLLGAIIVSVGMMSCKKNYTCACTTTDTSSNTTIGTTNQTIKETKKKAKDACAGLESTVGTLKTTCEIK